MNDVSAATLYDVLHDAEYRTVWDDHVITDDDLCVFGNNSIGYYSSKYNRIRTCTVDVHMYTMCTLIITCLCVCFKINLITTLMRDQIMPHIPHNWTEALYSVYLLAREVRVN